MKPSTIISIAMGVIAIIGGLFTADSFYVRAKDFSQLERRVERREMYEDASELRRRLFDLERFYGPEKAKASPEYREIQEQREMILRELQRK